MTKNEAREKILKLYAEYQKTQDKNYLEDIQKVVDKMGEPFVLCIEKPHYRITFKPKKATSPSGIILPP